MEKNLFKNILLKNINENLLNQLKDIIVLKTYKKDEFLFNQADECTGFYLIIFGKIKVLKNTYDGKEKVLSIFTKNALIGEVPVFTDSNYYPAAAVAIEDSKLIYFPKNKLLALIKQQPEISFVIFNILAKRLKNFINLFQMLNKEAPARVAYYLLNIFEENNEENIFVLGNSKGDIASILSMSAETFSRVFKSFKKKKLIKENGSEIEIINKKALEKIILEDSSLSKL